MYSEKKMVKLAFPQLYQEIFETQFLKETGEFYRHEAAQLKAECTCSDYLEKVGISFYDSYLCTFLP